MMKTEFNITGLDDLLKKFDNIQQQTKFKGGRFAMRKAANVVSDAVKEEAKQLDDPESRERIHANVAVRFSTRVFKRTGNLMFRVGIMGGAAQYSDTADNRRKRRVGNEYATGGSSKNPGGDTWYWRLIEFGTEKVSARPFMRPAIEKNTQKATDTFVQQFGKAIDRAIKRGGA